MRASAHPRAGCAASAQRGWVKEISMSDARSSSGDVAFTPAVKAVQTRKDARQLFAGVEERGGFPSEIDDNLAAFLADANSFYLATASADGQPYVQHRGGPKGLDRKSDV